MPLGEVAATAAVRPAAAAHVIDEVARRFGEVQSVATREAERRRELEVLAPLVAEAPLLAGDVHDLAGLRALGRRLTGGREAGGSR